MVRSIIIYCNFRRIHTGHGVRDGCQHSPHAAVVRRNRLVSLQRHFSVRGAAPGTHHRLLVGRMGSKAQRHYRRGLGAGQAMLPHDVFPLRLSEKPAGNAISLAGRDQRNISV